MVLNTATAVGGREASVRLEDARKEMLKDLRRCFGRTSLKIGIQSGGIEDDPGH